MSVCTCTVSSNHVAVILFCMNIVDNLSSSSDKIVHHMLVFFTDAGGLPGS